jgi:endonuclease III
MKDRERVGAGRTGSAVGRGTIEPAGAKQRPFDIDLAMARIRDAVERLPQPSLFQLAEEGFSSPFEVLVACIISMRTREEVTLRCARRLFALARAPADMAALGADVIDQAIGASTFHEAKAPHIAAIAHRVATAHRGQLPCDRDVLIGLRGIGPKCANLVLAIACSEPRIAVDVHVHRVTNRWGYVAEPTPERTLLALQERAPHRDWVDINRLLVPFGKYICSGTRPHCSSCVVLDMCSRIGVTTHR